MSTTYLDGVVIFPESVMKSYTKLAAMVNPYSLAYTGGQWSGALAQVWTEMNLTIDEADLLIAVYLHYDEGCDTETYKNWSY